MNSSDFVAFEVCLLSVLKNSFWSTKKSLKFKETSKKKYSDERKNY